MGTSEGAHKAWITIRINQFERSLRAYKAWDTRRSLGRRGKAKRKG